MGGVNFATLQKIDKTIEIALFDFSLCINISNLHPNRTHQSQKSLSFHSV